MSYLRGCDVSKYQSVAELEAHINEFDWVGVACTDGTGQPNTLYSQQVAVARKYHKGVLHYHYFEPAVDPVAQWNAFKHFAQLQVGDNIALDVEATQGLTYAQIAAEALTWLNLGKTIASPWIYLNGYWKSMLAATPSGHALETSPLWDAYYSYNANVFPAASPWNTLTAAQYSDKLDGIFDGDTFLGDWNTWKALGVRGTTPVPVPGPKAALSVSPSWGIYGDTVKLNVTATGVQGAVTFQWWTGAVWSGFANVELVNGSASTENNPSTTVKYRAVAPNWVISNEVTVPILSRQQIAAKFGY